VDLLIHVPDGFRAESDHGRAWRCLRALYGLKQGARRWNEKLNDIMRLVAVITDDFLFAGSKEAFDELLRSMGEHVEVIDLGSLDHFAGVNVEQTEDNATVSMHQSAQIDKLLAEWNMSDHRRAVVPMSAGVKSALDELDGDTCARETSRDTQQNGPPGIGTQRSTYCGTSAAPRASESHSTALTYLPAGAIAATPTTRIAGAHTATS